MKRFLHRMFRVIPTLLAGAAVLFSSCAGSGAPQPTHAVPDGGRETHTDSNAPKQIASDDLIRFTLEVYDGDTEDTEYGKYEFSLTEAEDGGFRGVFSFLDSQQTFGNTFEFEADGDFAAEVQKVIRAYDLISLNGTWAQTHGIPEGAGYDLYAAYRSGETLSSRDNASNAIPHEAFAAFYNLFYTASGAKTYYATDRLQNLRYTVYQDGVTVFSASVSTLQDGTVSWTIYEKDPGGETQPVSSSGTCDPALLNEISQLCETIGLYQIEEYPRTSPAQYVTLDMAFGKRTVTVRNNNGISEAQNDALLSLRGIIKQYAAGQSRAAD